VSEVFRVKTAKTESFLASISELCAFPIGAAFRLSSGTANWPQNN